MTKYHKTIIIAVLAVALGYMSYNYYQLHKQVDTIERATIQIVDFLNKAVKDQQDTLQDNKR